MLAYFRQLGQLRGSHEELRLGDIRFFQAGDRHLGFSRSFGGRASRIYVNRSGDPWEIPAGRVVLGMHLDMIAPDRLTLAPRGFCIVEE